MTKKGLGTLRFYRLYDGRSFRSNAFGFTNTMMDVRTKAGVATLF